MTQGLKLAFTGQEILRAIDERIARLEAAIQFKRDEIDGCTYCFAIRSITAAGTSGPRM